MKKKKRIKELEKQVAELEEYIAKLKRSSPLPGLPAFKDWREQWPWLVDNGDELSVGDDIWAPYIEPTTGDGTKVRRDSTTAIQ